MLGYLFGENGGEVDQILIGSAYIHKYVRKWITLGEFRNINKHPYWQVIKIIINERKFRTDEY